MRFVWAVVAFVIAALMIVAGIAQRTVFQGPRSESVSLSSEQDAPFTLIDGAVLNRLPGTQTLRAEGDGTIFVAYGRTADVKAWLSQSTFTEVSLEGGGSISAELSEPAAPADATTTDAEPDAAADPNAATTADPAAIPNPVGSDLWLDEYQQDDLLIAPLQLPDTMSVIVASDGTAPAPSSLSVTWPVQNATPWAGPLIVGGGILMLVGVFLYILGIRHVRRSRGPRRKALPPLPETQPIDLAIEDAEDKGVISATPTRRSLTGRRAFVVLPAVAVTALMLSGCSPDAWPQLSGTPTPTPTETVIVPEGQQAPAVTESQAQRILTRISQTVADADAASDATLAATRLDGAMLAERTTNYKLRAAIADRAPLSAIPTKPVAILLPQAVDGWPRTVMTVVRDDADATVPPAIMFMTQQDPWSEYKLSYAGSMEASAEIPGVAPAYVGARQVPPDSPFLMMAPDQLAAAYSDVLTNGDASSFFADFDTESDRYRDSVLADRQTRLDALNQSAATTDTPTATLEFSSTPGSQPAIALATIESGAIVAVNINEIDTAKPTTPDAVVQLPNNPTVKALTGVDQSQTGFITTFSDQLFFYVPAQGSTEKIRLLGYSSQLLDAQVIT